MSGFFSSMVAEMGERRRRQREAWGDWGRTAIGFVVFGGLALGSLGLYLRPWMVSVAPWGLMLPLLFVVGFVLIEWRRQRSAALNPEAENIGLRYDWAFVLWSFACAVAGAAAFVIAWTSQPTWTPPDDAVSVDISP